MRKKLIFLLRNLAKMAVQKLILPIAYELARLSYRGERTLYVFADAHHTELPFSLAAMYEHVVSLGIEPVCHFHDYTHEGSLKSVRHSIAFMKLRARAKYVFICDTFAPVSSGRRDKRTKVVQLCHYSGPFKKLGYATSDDVPAYYGKSVFKNYDLVTASSQMFVPLLSAAMRQPAGVVQPLGVSRSDVYYNEDCNAKSRTEFYKQYPQAQGRKVLLWAPTFRGKAVSPDALDNESMVQLQDKLGEEWLVLIKHHPHDDAVLKASRYQSNCSISSERLLPVVDLLITDYSTTVLDYLAYDKPFILYAPDLDEYEKTRGFFVDYRSLTKNLTGVASCLDEMVRRVYREWQEGDREDINRCRNLITKACDGRATERILKYLHNIDAK